MNYINICVWAHGAETTKPFKLDVYVETLNRIEMGVAFGIEPYVHFSGTEIECRMIAQLFTYAADWLREGSKNDA